MFCILVGIQLCYDPKLLTLKEDESDQIENQNNMLKLHEEYLIKSKSDKMKAVQTTVKSEIRSFSRAVKTR